MTGNRVELTLVFCGHHEQFHGYVMKRRRITPRLPDSHFRYVRVDDDVIYANAVTTVAVVLSQLSAEQERLRKLADAHGIKFVGKNV